MKFIKTFVLSVLMPLIVVAQSTTFGILNNTNDAYPSQTSLLVKTRQNWFNKDNSSNNFAITVNGDTRPSVKSPLTGYEGSTYFDGTGDYLTLSSNVALGLGSTFTLQAWIYLNSYGSGRMIADCRTSNETGYWSINSTGNMVAAINTTSNVLTSSSTIPVNTWTHVALVSNSSGTKFYINGSVSGSSATQAAWPTTARPVVIGSQFGTYDQGFLGYIAQLEIAKGIARYTGTFTPSTTPFVADANTILLTCQSPYTQNNNTFLDHSSNDFLITRNGNITQGTFGQFINISSAYLDGSSDYVSFPSNSTTRLGSGNWTIRCKMYCTSLASDRIIYFTRNGGYNGISLGLKANGKIYFLASNNGSSWTTDTYTTEQGIGISTNTWYDLTVVRSSNTLYVFTNGTLNYSIAITGGITETQSTAYLGRDVNNNFDFPGYISLFEINGTALYAAGFTPINYNVDPTNSKIFLKFENAAIYDGARKNNIETVGNIVNSFGQTRFNLPTINTDGSGSYAQMPMTANFDFGSNPFTIDGWFYLPSLPSAYKRIFGGINASGATNSTFIIEIDNTNKLTGGFEHSGGYATITHATVLTTGWHYFVLSRNGTTLSLSLDGSNQTATVSANAVLYSSSNTVFLGRWYTSGTARDFLGNTFDLRATKNAVRPTGVLLKPDSEF